MKRDDANLRIPRHLLDRLRRAAAAEAISVDEMALLALAEKLERLEIEAFYKARENRSEPGMGWRALERMGTAGAPPVEGDEVPADAA